MDRMESRTEQRLEALELKAIDAEDTLERLSDQLYQQRQQVDRLLAVVADLQRQLQSQGQPASLRSLMDERPPHY